MIKKIENIFQFLFSLLKAFSTWKQSMELFKFFYFFCIVIHKVCFKRNEKKKSKIIFCWQTYGFLRLENYTVQNNQNIVMFKYFLTPNNEMGVFNYEVMYYKVITGERQRLTLSIMEGPNDNHYSRTVLTTSIDVCKAYRGILPTGLTRSIFGNESYTKQRSCPYLKNHWYKYYNLTITDEWIPPIEETKFRLETIIYAVVQGKKSLTLMTKLVVFGRAKKDFLKLQ